MRWIWFLVLIVIAVGLQGTVVSVIRIQHIGPDLVFIVTMFYLLFANADDARLVAWTAGLVLDLFSEVRIGTFALSFGLVGLLLVRVRDYMFSTHLIVQVVLTLLGGFLVQMLARSMVLFYEPNLEWGITDVFLGSAYTAVFTAVLAPYILWVLCRLGPRLIVRPAGRSSDRRRPKRPKGWAPF